MEKTSITKNNPECIVMTSGGTGGHIFPALSVAKELIQKGYRVVYLTDKRGLHFCDDMVDLETKSLPSSSLQKDTLVQKGLAVFKIILGTFLSFFLLIKLRPKIVVGFGGYASFPILVSAIILRKKIIIHEQNAYLGKTNRLLAPYADLVASGFPLKNPPVKTDYLVIGNPVRKPVLEARKSTYTLPQKNKKLELFITGGSLGARIFSTLIPESIDKLPKTLQRQIKIVQQCRQEDILKVTEKYKSMNIEAELEAFFVDIAERIKKAHLIISRSGASTVSEVSTIGRPAIFIPYPFAADQHQIFNAEYLSKKKAAWMFIERDLTIEQLSAHIKSLLDKPQTLTDAAKFSKKLGSADACKKMCSQIETLIKL